MLMLLLKRLKFHNQAHIAIMKRRYTQKHSTGYTKYLMGWPSESLITTLTTCPCILGELPVDVLIHVVAVP